MGHPYTGNNATYPANYTIPDDGDPRTAASVNVALEALGDRTETIRAKGLIKQMRQVFTTAGAWTVWTKPTNFVGTHVRLRGHGGGGGGGGPATVANNTNVYGSGGSGGGGALLYDVEVDVSSVALGAAVNVYVGQGGAGALTNGQNGGTGEDTIFDVASPTVTLAGALGGSAGRQTTDANRLVMALGGTAVQNGLPVRSWEPATGQLTLVPPMQPGQGGHAGSPNTSHTFNGSLPTGQLVPVNGGIGAGIKGTTGVDSGSYRGGGPGGGGGAGPSGAGANGGNGGDGNGAGFGTAGTAGANAAAGSGAGGGGGGAPGHGSSGVGLYPQAGNGGSGRLEVIWWEKGVTLP